ncbi:hypothetical protein HDU83_008656 [Entophlyctis luteolus]|nr:hypothetical protein HDU83_008656 [Entophlyctis luteolus]KAJ3390394.1 hypothetical protein HDU84_007524 [Entophlyctis sp. JEL0112]
MRRHRHSKLRGYDARFAAAVYGSDHSSASPIPSTINTDAVVGGDRDFSDTLVPPNIVQAIFSWISPASVLKYSRLNSDFRACLVDPYFALLCLTRHLDLRNQRQFDHLFFLFPKSWQKAYTVVCLYDVPKIDWRGLNKFRKCQIPKSLCALSTLTHLNLGASKLFGQIPREIGRMISLEFLHLSWNQLSGPIPVELANLVNLKYFAASDNNLEGIIPSEMGMLNSLEHLDLSSNQLEGRIPPSIGGWCRMKVLRLQNNKLMGRIPQEISCLRDLEELNIYENAFDKWVIPESVQRDSRVYIILRRVGFYLEGENNWR